MHPTQIAEVMRRLSSRCEQAGVLDDGLRTAADSAVRELLRPITRAEARGLADVAEAAHKFERAEKAEAAGMN